MLSLEASVIEKLLMQLDRKGYPFANYQLNYKNEKPHILGRGGFSVVYDMVDSNKTDRGYALKLIGLERHTITSKKFWSTVRLQGSLWEQTPYVARLIQARELHITIDEEQNLVEAVDLREDCKIQEGIILQCILMEQLEPVITQNKFSHTTYVREVLCTEEEVLKLAIEIGQGIEVAHKKHILHRDIKLENILWDQSENKYVLGDFGLAKYVESGNAETVVYSNGYGAPEIEMRLLESYNETADIYSFGIVLYVLLNELQFPGSRGYVVNLVQYDPTYIFPAPKNASVGMTRMIRKMCSYYREDRYQSMAQVLTECERLRVSGGNVDEEMEEERILQLTETFHDSEEVNKVRNSESMQSRFKRKKREEKWKKYYKKSDIALVIVVTMLLIFFFNAIPSFYSEEVQRHMIVLTILVLVEASLKRFKEFHILFGIIAGIAIVYSALAEGITWIHILLGVSILMETPTFTVIVPLAIVLWRAIGILDLLTSQSWMQSTYVAVFSMILIIITILLKVMIDYRVESQVKKDES